jgi:hypothetical protein
MIKSALMFPFSHFHMCLAGDHREVAAFLKARLTLAHALHAYPFRILKGSPRAFNA